MKPAFYALAPGGWRDYVTLLHPPYTLWHLSYVVIGAAIAPEWRPGRLAVALGAFFLGLGIGAVSTTESLRWRNRPQLGRYLAALAEGRRPERELEELDGGVFLHGGSEVVPLLRARRVMFVEGPTAAELGAAVGREQTAAVGVVDPQLARGIRDLVATSVARDS